MDKERFSKIKIVMCDIDGTLLTDEGKVSSGTLDAIKKLREKYGEKVELYIAFGDQKWEEIDGVKMFFPNGDEELAEFRQLIDIVWSKIIALELPDISTYEPTLKGILAFEKDLLENQP